MYNGANFMQYNPTNIQLKGLEQNFFPFLFKCDMVSKISYHVTSHTNDFDD